MVIVLSRYDILPKNAKFDASRHRGRKRLLELYAQGLTLEDVDLDAVASAPRAPRRRTSRSDNSTEGLSYRTGAKESRLDLLRSGGRSLARFGSGDIEGASIGTQRATVSTR